MTVALRTDPDPRPGVTAETIDGSETSVPAVLARGNGVIAVCCAGMDLTGSWSAASRALAKRIPVIVSPFRHVRRCSDRDAKLARNQRVHRGGAGPLWVQRCNSVDTAGTYDCCVFRRIACVRSASSGSPQPVPSAEALSTAGKKFVRLFSSRLSQFHSVAAAPSRAL